MKAHWFWSKPAKTSATSRCLSSASTDLKACQAKLKGDRMVLFLCLWPVRPGQSKANSIHSARQFAQGLLINWAEHQLVPSHGCGLRQQIKRRASLSGLATQSPATRASVKPSSKASTAAPPLSDWLQSKTMSQPAFNAAIAPLCMAASHAGAFHAQVITEDHTGETHLHPQNVLQPSLREACGLAIHLRINDMSRHHARQRGAHPLVRFWHRLAKSL